MGHWEDYFLDAFNMFDIFAYFTMVYFCVGVIWFDKLDQYMLLMATFSAGIKAMI